MTRRRRSAVESVIEKKSPVKKRKESSPWTGFTKSVQKLAEEKSLGLMSPDKFAESYGVKYFISTGVPSLNLYLGQEGENYDTNDFYYGIPTGRFTEIVGNESSFKTFLLQKIGAEAIRRGGFFFYNSSELDFDLEFFKGFYKDIGVEWDEISENILCDVAPTARDLQNILKVIFPKLAELHKTNEKPGPVVIGLDSLAGMMGGENKDRLYDEKNDSDRTGSHASELHTIFKMSMVEIAKYDTAFVFTNQYRADMNIRSNADQKPAHNQIVKYYTSCRLDLRIGKKLKQVSRKGRDYVVARILNGKIRKVRGSLIGDGAFELVVRQNGSFDYLHSLVESMEITRIIEKVGKDWKLHLDPESENELEMELAQRFAHREFPTAKAIKQYLRTDKEMWPMIEQMCYVRGPWDINKEEEVDID